MIDVGRDFGRMRDYIAGRLSDEERRTFEDRLVREPALVREFEQSLRLREGLEALRDQGYFAKPASQGRWLRISLPALVAAAGAGLALLLWTARSTGPSPLLMASVESHTGAVPVVAAHFTFISVRGNPAPELDLPAKGLIEFRMAPAARGTASRYRLTLVRQDTGWALKPVGGVPGLALGADGYVYCYADAARLAPGSYLLRVDSEAESPGSAETFPFTLRRGPEPAP